MRLIDADALAEKKFQERECNGLGEGPAYRQGWNDAIDAVMDNEPSAQPEVKEIGYAECANAMLKMWIDNVLTDGEYNRIMDRLNAHHNAGRSWAESEE